MFRRRGFVRPFGRPPISDIPPALRRANELLANGNYPCAAQAYEELARGAVTRNGPRAPLLLLQAGRMHILAGQIPLGMTHLQQGLGLFAARGQWQQFRNSGQRLVVELSQRGLTEQAKQIETSLKTSLPAGFVPGPEVGPKKPNSSCRPNVPAVVARCMPMKSSGRTKSHRSARTAAAQCALSKLQSYSEDQNPGDHVL